MEKSVNNKIVYLSGAISSDPEYREKFRQAHDKIIAAGARLCLNPAIFPDGWEYVDYLEHCMLMVRRADVLVLLPCWQQSPGAKAEKAYAESLRRVVVEFAG